ncbi:vegetative cell wall protein gp1-like [Trematomus bernacchii]|uniref:vegetative cell wall protein gp1-like n=1 Tax=Trematomus bernacchii TaxID=40690 RepID=UPI00146BCBD2|nr:vegetative cell wall protein gp1-like [Trematomus bernacchii]
MERADRRNGEQVRPLRFHLNAPPDIPLTPLHKEVHDRPTAPTKPLPPDPALNPPPQLLGRPAPPNKPLPPDPGTPAQIPLKPLVPVKPRLVAPLPNCPPRHGAAANPAGPKRRPPLRPAGAQRVDSSAL